jgi:hypothetical protein
MNTNTDGVVFMLEKDSPLVTAIAVINDKCEKAGKGTHSVEYWCEELLSRGIETFSRYLDADKERRNRESYVKEMAKLTVPNPTDTTAMQTYAMKVSQLQRKFQIGASQLEV